ncbi:hypothetical protein Tco_0865940 [Tanacetum coccineum]
MKKELFAYQETISIMSQEKEAQIKFCKTRKDKEIEKVITSFVKPEFLKKAQRANPRLYDIGCYNDNLALITDKNDNSFKENQSNVFLKEREQYFEIQDLKAQLQDKGIAIRMYKVHTKPNQTRTRQLPQDIRKTNKRVSFSTGVIPTTSVSRPQLKRNQLEDRVMPNNSQGKKQEVEDHRMNFKFSNNKTFITACNDSLNAKTSNVNFVCITYGKCVLNDNHDMCVLHYINGVNSRTKMPMVVPISTREPTRTVNQSAATPPKRTVVAESTNQKPRSTIRKQYEQISKTCKWWYCKFTPSGYKWKPKFPIGNVNTNVSMPLGNASRTANILEPMTPRCSTVSNTPLSSNSFVVRRDNSIHHRLWVLKAHDGKSQASKSTSGMTEMPITTAEEKAQRRLEDAKKLLEAVEKRFGGNAVTKKTQRNLLKQQYENFTAPSSEMLDQTFDRLQMLVSQLELLDENLSQEDVNQKLLRSLSPEWNKHAVVWRNKADLDTMSMDDLYNNQGV